MTAQFTPIVNQPSLYVNNLLVSWANTTAFTINSGSCRDSGNLIDMSISSTVTVNATTSGVNGLDTGSLANNTWYYILLIGDSSGFQNTGGLISTSYTSPILPVGYDSFRLLGATKTDGSAHFLRIWQRAGSSNIRDFYWDDAVQVLTNGNSINFFSVSLDSGVPPIPGIEAKFITSFVPTGAGNSCTFRVAGSSSGGDGFAGSVAGQSEQNWFPYITQLAPTTASIDYKVSNGGDALTLFVAGFSLPC